MRACQFWVLLSFIFSLKSVFLVTAQAPPIPPKLPQKFKHVCSLKPSQSGIDDSPQILRAIASCGTDGQINFAPGNYNISQRMTWNLNGAVVNMKDAWLNFNPNIEYWLQENSTYRVIFIQDQASWFVVSGSDFEINAFNSGGIQGNGQVGY